MSSNIHPPSRSPSPPPDAPIAEAPGPRATGLQRMFDTTVKATLAKCSSTGFASCFPTPAKACPEQLEHIRTQLVEQLDRTWRANFDKIMKDREVVKSLNSLDQCITDAKSRKTRAEESANGGSVEIPTAPHSLSPSEIHLAHLMPFLEEQSQAMDSQLVATQQANTELLSTVTTQRAEIESLVHALESVIQDLESSAQMMAHDDVQGLSQEIRILETEMKR